MDNTYIYGLVSFRVPCDQIVDIKNVPPPKFLAISTRMYATRFMGARDDVFKQCSHEESHECNGRCQSEKKKKNLTIH